MKKVVRGFYCAQTGKTYKPGMEYDGERKDLSAYLEPEKKETKKKPAAKKKAAKK